MGHHDDITNPWRDLKNYTWSQHMRNRGLRGHKADVVVLDDYTDALNSHMADAYKKQALDELFGVK
jgi:hypothetical protein